MIGADDLFGGDAPPPPPPDPAPRIRRILAFAGPLNLMGPLCLTSVPGAFLSLWAWYQADEAMARLESGDLPEGYGPHLKALKNSTFANLIAAFSVMIFQILLFMTGVYQQLLEAVLSSF